MFVNKINNLTEVDYLILKIKAFGSYDSTNLQVVILWKKKN